MKNQKEKKSASLLYLAVCFIIVIASAELMVFALKSFEETQRVEAETLPDFNGKIEQNQTTGIIEDGYLIR